MGDAMRVDGEDIMLLRTTVLSMMWVLWGVTYHGDTVRYGQAPAKEGFLALGESFLLRM